MSSAGDPGGEPFQATRLLARKDVAARSGIEDLDAVHCPHREVVDTDKHRQGQADDRRCHREGCSKPFHPGEPRAEDATSRFDALTEDQPQPGDAHDRDDDPDEYHAVCGVFQREGDAGARAT